MRFAVIEKDRPVLIEGPIYVHAEVQYPVAGLPLRSDAELAEIGVYRVQTVLPPAGFEQTGTELVWDGGRVEERPVGVQVSEADLRARARANMRLSFSQMLIGLVAEGWITPEEGRAWRDRRGLPPSVVALIASLPPEQSFAAETRALAASEVLRTDPLVLGLALSEGKTPEEMDAFFETYARV